MIKAISARTPEQGPLVIFGLSHSNLELLKAGKPIVVQLSELGMKGQVLLFSGEDEITMTRDLEAGGLASPPSKPRPRRA